MPQVIDKYDFLIVGGGLFGAYAALYIADQGLRVALVEKEAVLFSKASIVNQARLHGGYHYPRSIATARMSDENKARFTREHKEFINFSFEKYYGIDRFGSMTDAAQFERFCDFVGIKYKKMDSHPFISMRRLEALYLTEEFSFDPLLIAKYYQQKLEAQALIKIHYNTVVEEVNRAINTWGLRLKNLKSGEYRQIQVNQVVNATYAASNAVNTQFGLSSIDLMHEISEMVFVSSPQISQIGLTVMDGPFASLMPYGKSDLLSLSSVAYTHHKVSYEKIPTFDCQQKNADCSPNLTANCNFCPVRPISNKLKMLGQIQQYFQSNVEFNYFHSFFTIKSKLRANFIDDGRPTEISLLQDQPPFYCIFAGKINSIYEIEKVLKF